MGEGVPKDIDGTVAPKGLTAIQAEMKMKSLQELRFLIGSGESDEAIRAAQEELSERGKRGAAKKARNNPGNTEEFEGDMSYKETSKWKELYYNHVNHLTRTYREYTDEGEPVTEEWLHEEATKMADAQYRMLEKQRSMEMRR